MKRTVIATMLAIGISGPALAQRALQVYDSRNTLIGPLLWETEIARRIDGRWYWLNATFEGLTKNAVFFFATNNCTGTAYLNYGPAWYVLPQAVFDGQVIWGPITSEWTTLNANSYEFDGTCVQQVTTTLAAPATKIDITSRGFHPPFAVR
jgi:hypothetical protein